MLRHVARIQLVAEDGFVPEHEGFDQGTDMVAHVLFPAFARGPPDGSEILVAGVRRSMRVPVLPDQGVLLRRYQDPRHVPFPAQVVDVARVVGAVARESVNR